MTESKASAEDYPWLGNVELLIVDDEPSILKLCGISLSRLPGFSIETVESVREARARLQAKRFDIVLTDVMLPDVSGLDLTREIKAHYPETDVIVMTGYPTFDSTVNALKLGAYDYIIKPIDLWLLRVAISRCAEKRHLELRLAAARRAARSLDETVRRIGPQLESLAQRSQELREPVKTLEESLRKAQHDLQVLADTGKLSKT